MKIRSILFLTFLGLSQFQSSICPMSGQELSLRHDSREDTYTVSVDGVPAFKVTLLVGLDECFLRPLRGETLWMDEAGELDMSLSYPPMKSDVLRLGRGLQIHTIEQLGSFDMKLFSASLDNSLGMQKYGCIGAFLSGNLYLVSFGSIDNDQKLFNEFLNKIELFAIENKTKRVQFKIFEDDVYLNGFLNNGYKILAKCKDLCSGKTVCQLYKELNNVAHMEDDQEFLFCVRIIKETSDEEKAFNECGEFFQDNIRILVKEFIPHPDPDRLVGIFIRDCEGNILGGCYGKIFIEAKVPHLYVGAVWIDGSLRGKNMARIFIGLVENFARKLGCLKSHLETAGYQAPWLYKKLGYEALMEFPELIRGDDGRTYSNYDLYKSLV